jgi:hypothetical protein
MTTDPPGTGKTFDDITNRRSRKHPKKSFIIAQLQKGMLIGSTCVSVREGFGIDQHYIAFMLYIM